ncbi:MAG: MFS transporter [Ectothiorhodospiraceae bacterium]|nr:MFS transporter [Ectothiorhodospiraceae bacterium]MCH8503171.1 MFS transporter [Ectothiorhodospiraceae bacterium]
MRPGQETAGKAGITQGAAYPPVLLAWCLWGLGAALYLAGFFHRVAPGVITDELMLDFDIGAAALGNLSAFYFYTYVAMQVPTGVLADRLGAKPLLAGGALLASAGALLFAFAPSLFWAAAGRALIGASVAVAFVCMLKLATHWMDARRYALASGVALCVGMVGAIAAGVPLRLAVDAFGWRLVMAAIGIFTLLLAALIIWLVRDNPSSYGYRSHTSATVASNAGEGIWSSVLRVFRYRNGWMLILIPGGVVGPLLAFAGLWGVPFLATHHAMSTNEAAIYTSALLLAWAVGGPAFGALSDFLRVRKALYLGGVATALAGWIVIFYAPGLPKVMLISVLMIIGLSSGAMILSFAIGKESVPPRLAGTGAGLINMGVMIGPMTLQPWVGWLLERLWDGTRVAGTPVYSLASYQWAFSSMLLWTLLSVVLLCFTRETGATQQAHD